MLFCYIYIFQRAVGVIGNTCQKRGEGTAERICITAFKVHHGICYPTRHFFTLRLHIIGC